MQEKASVAPPPPPPWVQAAVVEECLEYPRLNALDRSRCVCCPEVCIKQYLAYCSPKLVSVKQGMHNIMHSSNQSVWSGNVQTLISQMLSFSISIRANGAILKSIPHNVHTFWCTKSRNNISGAFSAMTSSANDFKRHSPTNTSQVQRKSF